MKVLFVDQNSSLGGGQRVLLDLVSFFKRNGISPFVVLPSDGYVVDALKSMHIPFSFVPMPNMSPGKKSFFERVSYPLYSFEIANKLEEVIEFFNIDLVFANGPRVYLPSVIAAKKFSKKVHLQLHLVFEKGIENKLISSLLKLESVKSGICCSNTVFAPFKGISPQKMKVVPYWVSPKFLEEKSRRDELRERYEFSDENIVVGCIGRFSKTKGQKFLLESLLPVLEEKKDVILAYAGGSDFEDPTYESEVKEMADKSKYRERIRFLGTVEGSQFYDAIDILAVPSLWEEAFGLVAVEGMARGLPVVATLSGALKEIVVDGKTGFVVKKDREEIRKKIVELIESEEKRKEFGRIGKERVLTNFNPEIQMRKVLEIAVFNV